MNLRLCLRGVLTSSLAGVACVQTLSRLNRTYPGTFVNDPEDFVESFQPYYQTAALTDVSDPNQIHDLFNKLGAGDNYTYRQHGGHPLETARRFGDR